MHARATHVHAHTQCRRAAERPPLQPPPQSQSRLWWSLISLSGSQLISTPFVNNCHFCHLELLMKIFRTFRLAIGTEVVTRKSSFLILLDSNISGDCTGNFWSEQGSWLTQGPLRGLGPVHAQSAVSVHCREPSSKTLCLTSGPEGSSVMAACFEYRGVHSSKSNFK